MLGHGPPLCVAPGGHPGDGPDGLVGISDAELDGPDQVLVTTSRGARLESGDEGLDGGLPLPLDPVAHPAARHVGPVQLLPDRPLTAAIEDPAMDAEPADGE